MFWYFLCKIHSVAMTSRTINYVLRVHFNSSSVTNDEFSSPFMEQWTLDAIGVLIISPTAGGGGLGRLRCNVDSEGGKYTSASPRCTCLPPRQHCAEVALGAFTTDSSAMLIRREASTPRLRLGVLAFLLMQLQLKYASSKFKYTSATPRCTWTWTQRTWAESAKYTTPRCSTYTIVFVRFSYLFSSDPFNSWWLVI